ncbi:tyrosine-type recombinase/integrase [Heliobacterium mobile]|uniref:tyrosine-type recombinase/integrase n=1 Tax=Heliobacterium mobile TaxID=28064 RepID=UPI0014793672|nr:tyrosine-type recombinase/integrase [Heliobacterium mobile]
MTLSIQLEQYRNYLTYERNYSPQTINHYLRTLRRLDAFLTEINSHQSPPVKQIRSLHIRRFLADTSQRGAKPSTLLHYIKELSAFFNYLISQGRIEKSPTQHIRKPKLPDRAPEYLTVDEMTRLFAAVDLDEKWGLRDLCILQALYYCGLRNGELTALKRSDIHDDFSYLHVQSGKGGKDRLIPLHHHLQETLRAYVRRYDVSRPDQPLFPSRYHKQQRLHRETLNQLVKRYAALAGIEKDVLRTHTFRHTFATHLYQYGVNLNTISELLGHSGLDKVIVYTHAKADHLKEAMVRWEAATSDG